MKSALLVLLFCFASSSNAGLTFDEVFLAEWQEFKATYNKSYSSNEENMRMKVFMENKQKIAKHNVLAAQGIKSYFLKMNHFGDLFHHEFVRTMNGYKKRPQEIPSNGSTFLTPHNVVLPKSVDWRKEGYVTPVKNQGHCGSCWSFSTTGSLEGQHKRKTGKLVSLSEQNLIDCSTSFGNNGCNGGLMDYAFAYIKSNRGLDTEKSYPYEGRDDQCRFKRKDVGADDTGYVDIPSGDEQKLLEAVATVGPISVAIDASHESFQFYSHGVYDEPECSSTELDHGVLVVGYGEERSWFKSAKYWIVKNSWGEQWGENGYIKIARGENRCGVATSASYPLV
ncbi:cathepsin L4-like protein [Dinothrombium tinctorium]|uniref:Cathepsin L4-like protein n=1 Tax=Dinothrombium tinctorium TaxID=1965070 RepID=A0A3S3QVU1_9ACAR|nr:cathepsin L4-like protein [Dinothrombium tinctorium]